MNEQDAVAHLPCWRGPVSVEILSGGLSNRNYLVSDARGRHVARFGQNYPFHHVDRTREVMVARAAHAAGFGPAVSHAADGVMVTEYLDARSLTGPDICAIPDRIGALLQDFHRNMPAQITGPGFIFWPFHVIRDYAQTLRIGASPYLSAVPGYLRLNAVLEGMQVPMPIIFGHHDLLPANILDDGVRLWLIDYEYAGFGTAMFDLAGVASNAGMIAEQTEELLTAYLGHAPEAAFRAAFDAMQCASLLRESIWAMVSALHMITPGVDFDAYARENLSRLDAAIDAYQSRHGKLPE